MQRKLRTAKRIYKKHGLITMFKESWRLALIKLGLRGKELHLLVGYDDVLSANWINNSYTPPKIEPKEKYRIAWVLPPVSPGAGGHTTAFRFVRYLEKKGHQCDVYFYSPHNTQTTSEAQTVLNEHFPPMKAKATVLNGDIEDCDAVFATSFETAYPVFNSKVKAKKFYFVQDFEPYFFGVGSHSVLAENTYRFGFYGITAGRWLSTKLERDYGMECDYFDFGSDPEQYVYNQNKKQKKVIFYARPVTERRAFELGVMALDLFKKKHPDYEIEFFGWDVSEYKLPFEFTSRGILSPDELNNLYNESPACLVMSLTNISLLPLELLSAGCIPVVNDGENNRMVSDNPYIQYTATSPHALADRLSEVVGKEELDSFADEASKSVRDLSWDRSGEKVHDILMRELKR